MRIGRGHGCGRRQLRHGNVIRMSVRAIRGKREDDVRAHAADLADDSRDRARVVRAIETLILVVEQRHLADAERHGGLAQLAFTNLAPDAPRPDARGCPGR